MSARRTARAAAALFAGLALAGCAGIPDSGPVRTNNAQVVRTDTPNIRVLARPPAPGANPNEIVSGFLNASANFERDHEIARTYLTSTASSRWKPDVGVAVYDSPPGYTVAADGPGRVRLLAFEASGQIDERGVFAQPTREDFRAIFTLTQVDGEWRIAKLPNGLILSSEDVLRAYQTVNLYFLDATGSVLVPDPLYLPSQRPGMATALTRQLLTGPTAWLSPVVRSAIPKGTKLAVDSVPVEDGIAQVDLDRAALAVTAEDRRALAAQITYTLTQLPDVRGVELTLNGVPYAVPGIRSVSTVADWEGFDPDAPPLDDAAYAIRDGALVNLTSEPSNITGWFSRDVGLRRIAVSSSGRALAGAVPGRGGGQEVRIGGPTDAQAKVVYEGRDITGLSIDRFDTAWIADRSGDASSLSVVSTNSRLRRVEVRGLGDRRIGSVRVSRDGARIAMVLQSSSGGAGLLHIGRVDRFKATPVVEGLRRIEHDLTDVADLAWADDSTLLVVARLDSEVAQAIEVGIDGDSVLSTGTVAGMVTVGASPGRPNLVGTTRSGLWVNAGSGWLSYAAGSAPRYAG